MARMLKVIILIGLVVATSGVMGADQPMAADFKKRARELKLSQKRAWQKMLLMPDRWFGREKSLVDDRRFFLSPDGRGDPAVELDATLDALVQPAAYRSPGLEHHPRCIFTARYAWLQKALGVTDEQLPAVSCPEYQTFRQNANYQKISLVFSHYYLNNPASMFGHTFLRFHKPAKEGEDGVLDDLLNFSAMIPDPDDWLYPFKGMAGGYDGKFALMPYYLKLQEYSNYESRDLWEFELNFTREQLDFVPALVWEWGWFSIDYYYLDDNCSTVLLSALEAIDSDLRLTRDVGVYMTPGDTLNTVMRQRGLVKGDQYRPSILSRYVYRVRQLKGAGERTTLAKLVKRRNGKIDDLWEGCDEGCEARILDTALDFVDYSEQIAGSNQALMYKDLRGAMLSRRAKLKVKPATFEQEKPLSGSPGQAHASAWVAAGAGLRQNGEDFTELHLRPALHDWVAAQRRGFSAGTELGLLDTRMRVDQKHRRGYLESLGIVNLLSLPPAYYLIQKNAWQFRLGYEKFSAYHDKNSIHQKWGVVYGVGQAWAFGDGFLGYGLINADAGWDKTDKNRFSLDPRFSLGLKKSWGLWGVTTLNIEAARYFSKDPEDILQSKLTWALGLGDDWETRLAWTQRNKKESEGVLAIGRYF